MIANLTKTVGKFVVEHSPAILTSIGVLGVVGTSLATVKAVRRGDRDILDAQSEFTKPLTFGDKAKLTWKYYVPPVLIGSLSIAAIIGAQHINTRRAAALLSLYTLSERSLTEYKEITRKVVGDEVADEIKQEVTKEHLMHTPMVNSEVIVLAPDGVLFLDSLSGRYFRSNMNTIEKAVNEVNRECFHNMHCSRNEFYSKIGLTGVTYGEDDGWRIENPLEIEYNSSITEQGEPCIVLEYHSPPIRGYYKEGGR